MRPFYYPLMTIGMLIGSLLCPAATGAESGVTPMTGSWVFTNGDIAAADVLDNGQSPEWRPVDVPGSLYAQGFLGTETAGWYRLRFQGDALEGLRQPAIILGVIQEADEVYLNGTFIGGSGRIGPFLDRAGAYKKMRVYPIPAGLARSDAANELFVKVQSYFYTGGMVSGPVGFGERDALVALATGKHNRILLTEAAIIAVAVAAWLIVFFMLLIQGTSGNRELLWLCLSLGAILCSMVPTTLSATFWGFTGSVPDVMAYAATVVAVVVFARYYQSIQLAPPGAFTNWLQVGVVAAGFGSLILLVLDGPIPLVVALAGAYLLATALLVVYLGAQTFLSLRHGIPHALVHFTGIVGLFCFAIVFQVIYPIDVNDYRSDEVGFAFFLACLVIGYLQAAVSMRRRMKELATRVFNVANTERRWISRELHDAIGQQLAALRLRLETIEETRDLDQLGKAQEDLNRGLHQMRNLMNGLNPAMLDKQGLSESVLMEVEGVRRVTPARLHTDIDEVPVDGETALHLFRIFQESLSNALRHGGAEHITIQLKGDDTTIRLTIDDDGIGFDIDEVSTTGSGLGLLSLKERVELVGGRLTVDTRRDAGTRIEVEVSP